MKKKMIIKLYRLFGEKIFPQLVQQYRNKPKAKEVAMEADIKKVVTARLEIENDQGGVEESAFNGEYFGETADVATLDDYARLVPLVPLVKTAWAEGRVTKRERHLVFEAAARMGIEFGELCERAIHSCLRHTPPQPHILPRASVRRPAGER